VLADISVHIEEMTEQMFNELRGVPDDAEKSGGNKVAMTKMPMARRSDPNSTPIFKSP
jgi:hypothetical protein